MCLEELFAQVFCYCEWVLLRKWHQNSYFSCSSPMYHQKPFQQRFVPQKMNVPHNQAPKKLWNQQVTREVSQCRCKVKQGLFIPATAIEAGYSCTGLGERAEAVNALSSSVLSTPLPILWPAHTSSCTITSQTHFHIPQSATAPGSRTHQLQSQLPLQRLTAISDTKKIHCWWKRNPKPTSLPRICQL